MLEKLRAERSGILAWIVTGGSAWLRDGLGETPAVSKATADYRDEQDVIGSFIAERLIKSTTARTRANAIYTEYEKWCIEYGEQPVNNRQFGILMTQRGYERIKNNGYWYVGVGIGSDVSH